MLPADVGHLTHWPLWLQSESTDVMIQVLHPQYQTCLKLLWPGWVCELFGGFVRINCKHQILASVPPRVPYFKLCPIVRRAKSRLNGPETPAVWPYVRSRMAWFLSHTMTLWGRDFCSDVHSHWGQCWVSCWWSVNPCKPQAGCSLNHNVYLLFLLI